LFINQHIIYNCARGTAQKKNMDMTRFKSLKIPILPLQIQEQLIQKCEKIDSLISELEQTSTNNKELAKLILEKSISNIQKEDKEENEQEFANIVIEDSDDEEIVVEDE
jgi:restriction endonuclease S subunit